MLHSKTRSFPSNTEVLVGSVKNLCCCFGDTCLHCVESARRSALVTDTLILSTPPLRSLNSHDIASHLLHNVASLPPSSKSFEQLAVAGGRAGAPRVVWALSPLPGAAKSLQRGETTQLGRAARNLGPACGRTWGGGEQHLRSHGSSTPRRGPRSARGQQPGRRRRAVNVLPSSLYERTLK